MRRSEASAWQRAVLAAAAALMLVSFLPLGARLWWVLDLATHFRLQYFAVGAVLLVLLARQRKPRWCAALVLCLAFNLAPVTPYLPPLARAAVAEGATSDIRLMAVNLSPRNFTGDALLASVRAEAPDVLLLVEFKKHWDRRLGELDTLYPHRLKIPADDAFGLALYSRHPFEGEAIELGATPAVRARVHSPAGAYTLVGVHLRSPTSGRRSLERNQQLSLLTELFADVDEPLAVIGDFNITPYSPFFTDWLRATGLRDARASGGPSISWPAFWPVFGIPIDHCIVSEEFQVITFRRLPAFGSDHYPVLAQLRLP